MSEALFELVKSFLRLFCIICFGMKRFLFRLIKCGSTDDFDLLVDEDGFEIVEEYIALY